MILNSCVAAAPWPLTKRLGLMMKLTLFFTLLFSASAFADGFAQRISLKAENTPLEEVMMTIQKQKGYAFFFRGSHIAEIRINAELNTTSLEKAMDAVLSGHGLAWSVKDETIIIRREETTEMAPQSGGLSTSVQQRFVTGKVVDEAGNPLEGVTVTAGQTGQGTTTDANGDYRIEIPSGIDRLAFAAVGYHRGDERIGNRKVINVTLAVSVSELDEVVVVGYGTQTKRDLTGAYSAVSGEVISERKTSQLSTALQGTMPGVMVTRTNSSPGASASIRIRGITSIGNTNPLFIVDGIYVPNIDDVNPADVESLTVLKDAASAAIYGSRAASGVILITTKRGKSDSFSLNYSSEYGISRPTASPQYVDVVRFMEMENELRWNDAGNSENLYPTYPKEIVDDYYNLNSEDPDTYPITDWEGMILKGYAPRQTHNLSVSGGTNAVKTNASFIYDYEGGLYTNRNFERISTRINNDFNISKIISAAADVYFKRSSYTTPVSIPNELMRVMPSIFPALWRNGGIADGKGGENPYAALMFGGTDNQKYTQLGGRINVDIKPLDGLKLSGTIAPKYNFDQGKRFAKKVYHNSRNNAAELTGQVNGHQQTTLQESRNEYRDVTYLFTADYSVETGGNKLNAMVGYESFSSFSENLGASRDAYELHDFPYLNVGPLTYRDNSGSASEIAYRSYFGRLSYNYRDRYLIQANVRRDGSSRFHEDSRWGMFPAFSAGWNLSEESFMPQLPFLSFLKFRVSWGMLGNDRIGNYPYQSTIAFNNGIFYRGNEIVSLIGAALQQYAIRDISWETTSSLNFGVDVSLFDNRLHFTGDIYDKRTKDMLLELEIPDYIGYENPDQNTGKMRTKGFDIATSWNENKGAFTYSVSANVSDFRSRIGYLGGVQFLGDMVKMEGSEFDEWYGYVSEGLYQTSEELASSAKLNNNVKIGDIKYRDISGPDGVPDGRISPEYDKTLLGGSLPRYLFGGSFNLKYQAIDFSLTIQGVGSHKVRKDRMAQPLSANYKNIPAFIDNNYWSYNNTEEENLDVIYPRLSNTASANNYILSDFWLFDGGYLRLKNISVGYTVPRSLSDKLLMKDLRIYGVANDLLSFNKYPDGWDPEMGGISSYPIVKSFIFGLSAKF